MDTLPPTRNVELMISEMNVTGPCCSCGATEGVLKCSRCKAVSYCGQDCQKKGWKKHKKTCNTINQFCQKTLAAIYVLANRYGGTAALLEAPLVKRGQFDIPSDLLIHENAVRSWSLTELQLRDKYVKARWSLAEAYAKCGQETFSRLAFRLAVENILDMICLSRNGQATTLELHLLKACTWMVAGDMDQLALNFFCYFTRRGQASRPFPYLDLSIDEDIEGASCITAVEVIFRSRMQYFPKMWLHVSMMISLIKVKRLQALMTQRRKEDGRWNAFMEGTHPGAGVSSVVLKLSGVDLVTEKLKEFVLDQSTLKRADLLARQINGLLEKVNERNPKLIPGILDRKTLEDPTFPRWDEGEEFFCNFEYSEADRNTRAGVERDIHCARYASNMYGHAWHMDREYAGALRLFLDTGNVMAEEKDTGNVMEEEKDTGNVKAGEEDTSIVKAEEEDTGNVKAEDKDAGNVKAEEKDTGSGMTEEDTSL